MPVQRKVELLVFAIAGATHLALGWHFKTADFAIQRHIEFLPFITVLWSVVYASTGVAALTKWRISAFLWAKVSAVIYLLMLFESYSMNLELVQALPSILVICFRNSALGERDDGF